MSGLPVPTVKFYALILTKKMGWATSWAIFSQTHPVTLGAIAAKVLTKVVMCLLPMYVPPLG
jgi:hypothetical protein